MAKPISELINKLPPEVNAQATVKAAQMLTEISLSEPRKEQGVTQVFSRLRGWSLVTSPIQKLCGSLRLIRALCVTKKCKKGGGWVTIS